MPVPFFSLFGTFNHLTLIDPMLIFTPLTCGLVLLAGLCGLGIGLLLSRMPEVSERIDTRHSAPSSLPKAA